MRIGNRTCLECYSYFLQFQLVRMLSPLEIQKARDIFHAFDKDEDGYINSHEVAVGFNRWFGNLRVFDKDRLVKSVLYSLVFLATVSEETPRYK